MSERESKTHNCLVYLQEENKKLKKELIGLCGYQNEMNRLKRCHREEMVRKNDRVSSSYRCQETFPICNEASPIDY